MPNYRVSYIFVGIYVVLAIVALALTHWGTAINDALIAILFYRVGMYEQCLSDGRLAYRS